MTLARAVHRKGATFENLELFFKVKQIRSGNISVYCDQDECLREVVHNTAKRLGLSTRVTAIAGIMRTDVQSSVYEH